jgi:hypothetical protein
MIWCRKPYILCTFYGEFWSTKVKTLATVFSSPPRQCSATHAKSTILEGWLKTDAHAGALSLARGAPEPTTINAELAPSRPAHTSRHCCPMSSQGEQSRFSVSPWCHRWKPCRVRWTRAPVTAYSGEPPPWAGCAADRSAAPLVESLLLIHSDICSGD